MLRLEVDNDNGTKSVAVVDRDTMTAIVLACEPGPNLSKLVSLCKAAGAPTVRLMVADNADQIIKELTDDGWKLTSLSVLQC